MVVVEVAAAAVVEVEAVVAGRAARHTCTTVSAAIFTRWSQSTFSSRPNSYGSYEWIVPRYVRIVGKAWTICVSHL